MPFMPPAQTVSDEERVAAAKKTAWGWMKKLHVKDDDARQIWKVLEGNLDKIESFLKIFPNKVPLVVGADEALTFFLADECDEEKTLPALVAYGKAKAEEIAGPPKVEAPTIPANVTELFNTFEIAETERWAIWTFFSGTPLDEGGPFQATEDFLSFRTSRDVEPHKLELSYLLNVWAATDGHLRKAKQAVAEKIAEPKPEGTWFDTQPGPDGITKAGRDITQDAVLFDVTAVWKWIKTSGLDATKANRDRIAAIIKAASGDWKQVVTRIKQDFSK
jgi:hypothetical protein